MSFSLNLRRPAITQFRCRKTFTGHWSRGIKHWRQAISTLDPRHLTPYDHIDISDETTQSVRFETAFGEPAMPTKFRYVASESNYRIFKPFPPKTKGFLYLHRPNHASHPAAGSLRFRVVQARDPKGFESGEDLLLPVEHGLQPWSIPLLRLRIHPEYRPFYDHLLYSNVVSPEQDEAIQRMLPPAPFHPSPKAIVMEPMDRFCYDFGKEFPNIVFLGGERIYQHRFRFVPKSRYSTFEEDPYSGIGILRIELIQAKSGLPRLVLRLLKWAVPPKALSDTRSNKMGMFMQREGELVKKIGPNNKEEVWSTNPFRVFGEDKVTMRKFERKYLGM
ncbi:hypothetical protein BKA70DRAFT_1563313 [Coprinopsis sp. MPI-PUGE-AT-0042]|nr:hypothetical protein BKA70DRAFT_1563313 [Coprinopsis sp. MPI-PUGE-AT-0042]